MLFFCVVFGSLIFTGHAQQVTGYGQKVNRNDQTSFSLERAINLKETSTTETILIKVEKNTIRFELDVISRVNEGKLIIEIYSPDGKKQGSFLVETQLESTMQEVANGKIKKALLQPTPGDWKVKILPEKVSGQVKIEAKTLL